MLPRARRRRIRRCILTGTVVAAALVFIGLIGCRVLFPLGYRQEILAQSTRYGLDPALVAAVIRNESRFRADAVSSAGALGLMQIMPETGRWIAGETGIQSPARIALQDAATNIALGTWYLRYLFDRFSSSDTALMAYNAGPSYAEQWQGDLAQAFSETQRYIRRIHASLPVYQAYFAVPWLFDWIVTVDPRY
jgi:soluble lytic murein transglycosylase